MRLKIVLSLAALMAVVGTVTAACGSVEPNPNSFQFIENRSDP